MTDAFDWRDDERHLGAARVLGGSSAVNACAWTRPPDEDFAAWVSAAGEQWSAEALAPAYERVE
jgi:choline dehydrogenase-like flavoprotein